MSGHREIMASSPVNLPRPEKSGGDSRGRRPSIQLRVEGRDPVPLLYCEQDERTYVIASDPPGAWFSAAVREGRADVRWPDGRHALVGVRLLPGPEPPPGIRTALIERYGLEVWSRYFARSAGVVELDPHEVRPPGSDPERIRLEFEASSSTYDTRLQRDPVERYLKERVVDLSRSALNGLDPILEIGPGTGFHTVPLLEAGHRVVAVDVSERMLTRLRHRASRAGVASSLETRVGSSAELERVLSEYGEGSFGGAFSAFGAFDLERDVERVADVLARLVRPGGRLAFTSLNRPGWAPFAWELALSRVSAAGARLQPVIPVNRIRYPLTLYPRSPGDWDHALGGSFRRSAAEAISVLSPPFDAGRIVRLLGPEGRERLSRWDRWLSGTRVAGPVAEWVFLTYTRRSPTAAP